MFGIPTPVVRLGGIPTPVPRLGGFVAIVGGGWLGIREPGGATPVSSRRGSNGGGRDEPRDGGAVSALGPSSGYIEGGFVGGRAGFGVSAS